MGSTDPYWIARNGRVLGNGRYRVFLDQRGGGVSCWRYVQLSGWEPDGVLGGGGWWISIATEEPPDLWFVTPGPPDAPAVRHRVQRLASRQVYRSRRGTLESVLEVWVDCAQDVEVRRLTVANRGTSAVRLMVTSHCDVVLNDPDAHRAHPTFSKLFVESTWYEDLRALCFRRRPRSADEQWPWWGHMVCEARSTEAESDRARFLGRWREAADAAALRSLEPLAGRHGSVLDPTAVLRQRTIVAAGDSAQWTFVAAVAQDRDALCSLLSQFRDPHVVEASSRETEQSARDRLRGSRLSLRLCLAAEEVAVAALYGQGEKAARVSAMGHLPQTFGAIGGLSGGIVLWEGEAPPRALDLAAKTSSLLQERGFQCSLLRVSETSRRSRRVAACSRGGWEEHACSGIVALAVLRDSADLVVEGDRLALPSRANETRRSRRYRPRIRVGEGARADGSRLEGWNGYGGFDPASGDYVIELTPQRRPPMPWVNVMANPRLGCLASERGTLHTWGVNSREDRLTPWTNDPVRDPFVEALYVRDETERVFWSPLPGPAVAAPRHTVRHGLGFSRWESQCNDLRQAVTIFVAPQDPLRLVRIELENLANSQRRLSLWWYAQLVLGSLPEWTRRSLRVRWDARARLLSAQRDPCDPQLPRIAFATLIGTRQVRASGCRLDFLGTGCSLSSPRALQEEEFLTGCFDHPHPAFVLQGWFDLPPQGKAEMAVLFGEARSLHEATVIAAKYHNDRDWKRGLVQARSRWRALVGRLEVRTPLADLDRLVNGWSVYQAVSCRLWGRSAFYQSGGAFGFRDQLQDACALLWLDPAVTRRQILLHAAHQFPEGDVLHWWHPPWERGTRTRFSDDLLWLPWAVVWYIQFTGDAAILDERCPFVEGRVLAPGEDEAYLAVRRSSDRADLYTHCCLAIDRSLTRGSHGLPLMGTGDWNDGMNRVGRLGRGESVWLGFFLAALLRNFIPICRARGDAARAQRYQRYERELARALEEAGWDGSWYRRAYYDDGSPLGSAVNQECRIDALVQAWAVISGVAPRHRAEKALDAVLQWLVDDETGIVRLLAPPFDRDPRDPGYIKGYVPGIRENGGQYTHAALWVVQALALCGRRNDALRLLARMLPQWHARDEGGVVRYQVEPYVIAADIYGVEPHRGRGGWTWYTGSAGWLYRVTVETILGLRLEEGKTLALTPRIPDAWPSCEVLYRPPGTRATYRIRLQNPTGCAERIVRAFLDGRWTRFQRTTVRIPLSTVRGEHEVVVELGPCSDHLPKIANRPQGAASDGDDPTTH